jgi:SAM-dependent methyltransferase
MSHDAEPLGVKETFTPDIYEQLRSGTQESAAKVTPLLVNIFKPVKVVDVGCGEGWWAREFARHECSVVGVDETVPDSLDDDGVRFHRVDLRESFASLGRFDLAICLEVAEHLPPQDAEHLVTTLCDLAPTALFSAAVPGQGGHGHVNEQWPGYWASLFESRGYTVSGALRWLLWDEESIEPWYRQNLLAASCEPARWPAIFKSDSAAPFPLIHPAIFERRLAEYEAALASSRPTVNQARSGLRAVRYRFWQATGLYVSRIPR